jgi:hypothetical protein
MYSEQRHIINTLRVDVETQNTATAFHLKDHLDVFLKQEIFPYLERYFSSLEKDLETQTIQIPSIAIDVRTSSSLNFEELKQDVKHQLVKEIESLVENAHSKNDKATLISSKESAEDTWIHFLKTGTQPWWSSSEKKFQGSNEIGNLLKESSDFPQKIKAILRNPIHRKRLIAQSLDAELKDMIEAVFSDTTSVLLTPKLFDSIKNISLQNRQLIWDALLDYADQNDLDALVARNLFILSDSLESDVKKSDEHRFLLTSVVELLRPIESHSSVRAALKIINEHRVDSDSKNNSKEDRFSKHQQTQQKRKSLEKSLEKTELEETTQDKNSRVDVNENIDKKIKTKNTVSSIALSTESEFNEKEKAFEKEANTKTEKNAASESSGTSKQQEELDSSEQKTLNNVEIREGEEKFGNNFHDVKTQEEVHAIDHKFFEKSERTQQAEESSTQETLNERFNTTPRAKETSETPTEKEIRESILKPAAQVSNEIKLQEKETSQIINTKQLKKKLESLIEEQDQVLFKELHEKQLEEKQFMEEKGEFQIQNAGLILLHPYIQSFFGNCQLLDAENRIVNPDLAVHLLHYLATKQELQWESNMLFEKILCGMHSKTIIQRNVVLSEELKSNAEELLEAVLQNWGVLKNASPDLLRNEFLQRFGKISFKEVNPKITIERKVHDILLDKLPWNLGICGLPWLDHLLFTDW